MNNLLNKICEIQEKINNKTLINKYVSNHVISKLDKMKKLAIRKGKIKLNNIELKIIELSNQISQKAGLQKKTLPRAAKSSKPQLKPRLQTCPSR